MLQKYNIVIDAGDPYDRDVYGDDALKSILLSLKAQSESGDFAYVDVWVYLDDKDVTDEAFKRLKINDEEAV